MNWLLPLIVIPLLASAGLAQQTQQAHAAASDPMQQQVEKLAAAVAQERAELESSRSEIQQLRLEIAEIRADLAASHNSPHDNPSEMQSASAAAQLRAEVGALREQADVEQSEIAVHEQAKVESESKFPVKLTGLILMNIFANSSGVDVIQSPAIATDAGGTTGLSLRQTVLGLDARGPHLLGATSSADVRVDFFGGLNQAGYTGATNVPRLRTAHAEIDWSTTRAFIEMDRPIVNPNTPTSLTAIAEPALAWSGNLWNWIPQLGAEHSFLRSDNSRFTVAAAIADVPDPAMQEASLTPTQTASLAERSRWPGSEARIGYLRGDRTTGFQIGIGGYFSPHYANADSHFDAWAATADYRIPVSSHFEVSGNLYRGLALGGLGGGTFKDYIYKHQGFYDVYAPLDDIGGWTQFKARANERLEFNVAYGMDNAFAGELRGNVTDIASTYQNIARNSTVFTNMIFSPTAYTLFSLEYRRIDTSPVTGPHWISNVFGVAAGYRF